MRRAEALMLAAADARARWAPPQLAALVRLLDLPLAEELPASAAFIQS